MAYMESNDTSVHTIEYTWYGENQYPSTVSIPYPKVGHPVRNNVTVDELRSRGVIFTSIIFICSQVLPTLL